MRTMKHKNKNARGVMLDMTEPRRPQYVKRRQAIRAHRSGERRPVKLGVMLSSVPYQYDLRESVRQNKADTRTETDGDD